jgi:selenophosphate synthase
MVLLQLPFLRLAILVVKRTSTKVYESTNNHDIVQSLRLMADIVNELFK